MNLSDDELLLTFSFMDKASINKCLLSIGMNPDMYNLLTSDIIWNVFVPKFVASLRERLDMRNFNTIPDVPPTGFRSYLLSLRIMLLHEIETIEMKHQQLVKQFVIPENDIWCNIPNLQQLFREFQPSEETMDKKTPIKTVAVGSSSVGKTTLLARMISDSDRVFQSYLNRYYLYFETEITSWNSHSVFLWDTQGQEDYDKLRPLCYPETHVMLFVVCFRHGWKFGSMEEILKKFLKETNFHCPRACRLVVGAKQDLWQLTEQDGVLSRFEKMHFHTADEGRQLATTIGALDYIETSAMNGTGREQLFEAIVKAFEFSRTILTNNKKKKSCLIC